MFLLERESYVDLSIPITSPTRQVTQQLLQQQSQQTEEKKDEEKKDQKRIWRKLGDTATTLTAPAATTSAPSTPFLTAGKQEPVSSPIRIPSNPSSSSLHINVPSSPSKNQSFLLRSPVVRNLYHAKGRKHTLNLHKEDIFQSLQEHIETKEEIQQTQQGLAVSQVKSTKDLCCVVVVSFMVNLSRVFVLVCSVLVPTSRIQYVSYSSSISFLSPFINY